MKYVRKNVNRSFRPVRVRCRSNNTSGSRDIQPTKWGLGYRELASVTDRGNVTSMAWHWRNGFFLSPHKSVRSKSVVTPTSLPV